MYEQLYDTLDIVGGPEVRAQATAKVLHANYVLHKQSYFRDIGPFFLLHRHVSFFWYMPVWVAPIAPAIMIQQSEVLKGWAQLI